MWLFLLTNMMTTAGNGSNNAAGNADNDNNMSTAKLNIHVNSTDDNLHDYSSFNMNLSTLRKNDDEHNLHIYKSRKALHH